jgi:hypothetical protein
LLEAVAAEACPDDDALATFAQGFATGEERARIEDHVKTCATCGDVIASMVATFGGPDSVRKAGRYELVKELGRGGMGVVFEARDPVLGRRVAVKVLSPTRGGEGEEARLLREARAMARVAHPNVVTVYDAGVEGGRVFLAMEIVRGPSRRELFASRPDLSVDERLELFRGAGRALAAAHAANVVHRDFKPENVLVGESGARVTDFGLARPSSAGFADLAPSSADARWITSGVTRGVHGTPAYMSPEQIDGRETIDARSDQFSFGVALYEAFYRAHPFGLWAEGAPETLADLRAAMERGPRRPAGHGDVPAWVWPVVARALHPRPDARWPSMDELVRRLDGSAPAKPRADRLLERLSTALWVMCGLHLPLVAVVAAALVMPDEGEVDKSTFVEKLGGVALLLASLPGAAFAPLAAWGLSRRAWWATIAAAGYALVALPTAVGTPVAILVIYTLAQHEVRAALAAR